MTLLRPTLVLSLSLLTAACGGEATRYLVTADPVAPPEAKAPVQRRLRVSTIELREVVLPAYGEDSQILLEGADGGLSPLKGSEWADGSARAITAELARSLDLGSTASVAAEPWPLSESADVRLEVRIERMVARKDGLFQLSGQFAISSLDGRWRDRLQRYDLRVALPEASPSAVAAAYGRALNMLSQEILSSLAR